ncbi:hypothetical protein KIN20_029425, partial [Parelaphostrongylus tenuis]
MWSDATRCKQGVGASLLAALACLVNMAYSESATVRTQFAGFAATREAASSFVSRLVMQTVTDVLEQQGHSAGLPDFIISNILNQLMIRISYDPLECKDASSIGENFM